MSTWYSRYMIYQQKFIEVFICFVTVNQFMINNQMLWNNFGVITNWVDRVIDLICRTNALKTGCELLLLNTANVLLISSPYTDLEIVILDVKHASNTVMPAIDTINILELLFINNLYNAHVNKNSSLIWTSVINYLLIFW